jgi:hypothetical protein
MFAACAAHRQSMETLMDSVSGRYSVQTFSGSTYVVDLDEMWLLRRRGSGLVDVDVSALRRDDEQIRLVEIVECTVLRRPTFILDIVPGLLTIRRPTIVLSIEPIADGVTGGGQR